MSLPSAVRFSKGAYTKAYARKVHKKVKSILQYGTNENKNKHFTFNSSKTTLTYSSDNGQMMSTLFKHGSCGYVTSL